MRKGISETAFGSQVESLFTIFGWRWTHFRVAWSSKGYRTPIKGHKGFVDYVAVRDGIVLFIEIKSESGKLSPDQEEWGKELKRVADHSLGVMYCLWKPSDFDTAYQTLKPPDKAPGGL